MVKKTNGTKMDTADQRDLRPVDTDDEWIEIYERLRARIGVYPAFNWFAACRFVGVRNGLIRLEHWGVFPAQEALKQHGFDLCIAAGVSRAEIGYSGGYPPKNWTGTGRPAAEGKAVFVMPRPGAGRAHLTQEGVTMSTKNDEVEGFL